MAIRRWWSRRPAIRSPACATRWPASPPAGTWSWSTSRRTCWPGPLLARRAAEAGTVYSLAYGDQPALIVELVDWARTCGFEVVCAGKGTKYLPAYHASTPDTVWQHYGISPGARRERRHEREDVQLVPGRHEVRDRDGRGGERDGAAAGGRMGCASRHAGATSWPRRSSRPATAERSRTRGPWRWSRHCSVTAVPSSAIFAGGCT